MYKLDSFLLKYVFKRICIQGFQHILVIQCMRLLKNALLKEFTEDNEVTINAFMQDCLDSVK